MFKNKIIMFGSISCPACVSQKKLIDQYCRKTGVTYNYLFYDVDKLPMPKFLQKTEYIPVWVKGKKVVQGQIDPVKLVTKNELVRPKSNRNSFGGQSMDEYQAGNGLFPDSKGFKIPNSFVNSIQNLYGKGDNMLVAGTIGRELGTGGDTNKLYTSEFFYQPRMAYPGGDLDTLLNNNVNCNVKNNDIAKTNQPGLFSNATEQFNVSGFGSRGKKKKQRFGMLPLYSQAGYAYKDNYLVDKDTVKMLGGGFTDASPFRPGPGESLIEFGRRGKKNHSNKKIGEGTVLTVRKGKVKIK